MKFLKLGIRNYRGVATCSVAFQETGVTIVEGPNEVGKTSLAEAIDLLFDYQDSSRAAAVRAVQPVGRGGESTVALEFRVGRWHATYVKAFNGTSGTQLTIHAPVRQQLTGREAHGRVEQMLAEHVDIALWRTLRIKQGDPLNVPTVGESASLTAALDKAAGEARAGLTEMSLFDAARQEYERFYTATGREKAELKDASERCASAKADVEAYRNELGKVQRDVEESARLDARISQLTRDIGALDAALNAAVDATRAIEQQERRIEAVETQLATHRLAATQASERLAARCDLVRRVEQLRADRERLLADVRAAGPELERLRSEETVAASRLEHVRLTLREARASADAAAADFEYRSAELEHTRLSERLIRVREAEAEHAAAAEVLEENRVTAKRLEAVRAAHLALAVAKSAAETGSPELQVDALRDIELHGSAGDHRLHAGELWSSRVLANAEVQIGDAAVVRVIPAAGVRELTERLRTAEADYAMALLQTESADIAAAELANAVRADAERTVERTDKAIRDNLRDLTVKQIEHKIESLRHRAERHLAGRPDHASLPATFDDAQELKRTADAIAVRAQAAAEEAVAQHAPLRNALEVAGREATRTSARADQQLLQLTADEVALANARESVSDDILSDAAEMANSELQRAQAALASARAALADADPEGTRLMASNANEALAAAQRQLTDAREKKTEVRVRLESAGERGLTEALSAAEEASERAGRVWAAQRRQAAAAKLLYGTLRDCRDEARRAYVRPLATQLQKLGAIVCGPDFAVELSDDLTVVSRTLNGDTVPFASLSGGAREQISLLMRVACALVVASDGGVPLIFDDALGNSDVNRLDRIGAVLAMAGQRCQVIVLTCAPDRYRTVGSAERITLSPAAAETDVVLSGLSHVDFQASGSTAESRAADAMAGRVPALR
jgi:DNA repair exonuclease SbcCD ATPase subunit